MNEMQGKKLIAGRNEQSKINKKISFANKFKIINDKRSKGNVLIKVSIIKELNNFLLVTEDKYGKKYIDAKEAIKIKYKSLIFIITCQ